MGPFSRRISLIAFTSADLAPPNSTRHCSTLVQNYKMSQKSITSFFVRKAPLSTSSTSDGDGSKNSPSPVKKEKSPIEKKEKTPKEKKEKNSKREKSENSDRKESKNSVREERPKEYHQRRKGSSSKFTTP